VRKGDLRPVRAAGVRRDVRGAAEKERAGANMMHCIKKHQTREEKRRIQRLRADLLGVGVILLLLAAGFAAGKLT